MIFVIRHIIFLNDIEMCCTTGHDLAGIALDPVSVKKMGEGRTGGASEIVKAKSSGEDPRATGGLISNFPHPQVNKTKQHAHNAAEGAGV